MRFINFGCMEGLGYSGLKLLEIRDCGFGVFKVSVWGLGFVYGLRDTTVITVILRHPKPLNP